MDFQVKEREHPNIKRYAGEDFKLAQQFSNAILKELGDFLKAVVLFGSAAREAQPSVYERDIDILMIIDDLTMILSPEVVQAYRVITEKTAARHSKRLHINTLKLSNYWEYVRNGDPIIVNMLREGVPLHDIGIFKPVQMLLYQGRIRPTKESIWSYFSRAPATIASAEWHLLQAALDLYWAVIDSAHAALMKVGEIPPSPSHVSSLMTEKLVKPGLVSSRYAKRMDFFYQLSKKITRREIQRISGKDYELYKQAAEDFINAMKKVVEKKD